MHTRNNVELPSRRSVRLKTWDYSDSGWYYLTICTYKRTLLFGNVVGRIEGNVVGASRGSPDSPPDSPPAYTKLNHIGEIVKKIWLSIPIHHNVMLDEYIFMPNHMHGIVIMQNVGGSRPAPTLGNIIGLFKSECTKSIRRHLNNADYLVWQRNYYEHIIRNEKDLLRIRHYIKNNPNQWFKDSYNPDVIK